MATNLKVGQRITCGAGEDRDSGIIDVIDGDAVTVRWDSLVVTTQSVAAIEAGIRAASDDQEVE